MSPLIRRSRGRLDVFRRGQAPVNGLLPVRFAADRVHALDALRGDPHEVRARLSEHIPLCRYGAPEEFGWAAAFVLSPAASHVTGAMIRWTAVPSARSQHPVAGKAAWTKVPEPRCRDQGAGESDSDHVISWEFLFQPAWRSVPPVCRAGRMLSRNPGE